MIPLALAGAGLGALESIGQKNQEAADERRRINEIRFSPWTGMDISKIGQVQHPSTLGNIYAGAVGGADFQQKMQDAATKNATGQSQGNMYDSQAALYRAQTAALNKPKTTPGAAEQAQPAQDSSALQPGAASSYNDINWLNPAFNNRSYG